MEQFSINISCRDQSAVIRLLDSEQKIVVEQTGSYQGKLLKGIYRVQINLLGVVSETQLKVNSNIEKIFPSPGRFSSALLSGYGSSHEYYSGPATEISRTRTLQDHTVRLESSLFIFIRFASIRHRDSLLKNRVNLFENFKLFNKNLDPVHVFMDESIRQDLDAGYAGVSLTLESGIYYLCYVDDDSLKLIPVQLFQGWQTQVFLIMHEKPLFDSLRVLMGNLHEGFNPDNELARQVDMALLKLENRSLILDKDILKTLAYGKWENPLLGILWCYLYTLNGNRDQENLFEEITRNLRSRILFSNSIPDLKAIDIITGKPGDNQFENADPPPMFSVGFNEIVKRSYDSMALIRYGSTMSFLASKLYSKSVWTVFSVPYSIFNNDILDKVIFSNKDRVHLTRRIIGFQSRFMKRLPELSDNLFNRDLARELTSFDWANLNLLARELNRIFEKADFSKLSVFWIASSLKLPYANVKENIDRLIILNQGLGSQQTDVKSSMIFSPDQLTVLKSIH